MMISRVQGATRVLGKSQGYLGLPVLDTKTASGTPCMVTSWEPTPDEIAKISLGAPIRLVILGSQHPPVMLEVGEPPSVV